VTDAARRVAPVAVSLVVEAEIQAREAEAAAVEAARKEQEAAAAARLNAAQEKQRLREAEQRAAAEEARAKAEAEAARRRVEEEKAAAAKKAAAEAAAKKKAAEEAAAKMAAEEVAAKMAAGKPPPLPPVLRDALDFFRNKERQIVLMGNDGIQEFLPARAHRMGGIENAVVTLANGLHRLGYNFIVLSQCTGMDPISTTVPLAGVPYTVYCMPPGPSFLPACQEYVRNMNPKPAVVLGQSDWSARVAEAADVPMVVTNHDSAPAIGERLIHHPRVFYRFLSDWMIKIWQTYGKEWLPRRSFFAYHSIEPDACPPVLPKRQRAGHVMYLSSAWGPELKGLDKFCEFASRARAVSNRTFVVYGPNSIPGQYANLPNLKAMGDVSGKARDDAYRNAILYVMLTQLPEAFGRVTLEAMCMGTPVLSSCFGTQPELIYGDAGGRSTDNNYDTMLAFLAQLDKADDDYFEGIRRYATTTFVQDEEIARLLYAARLLIEQPTPVEHEKTLRATFDTLPYSGVQRIPSEKTTADCKTH
jgi:glycosyltransferase involved in cell wall biosynthesis